MTVSQVKFCERLEKADFLNQNSLSRPNSQISCILLKRIFPILLSVNKICTKKKQNLLKHENRREKKGTHRSLGSVLGACVPTRESRQLTQHSTSTSTFSHPTARTPTATTTEVWQTIARASHMVKDILNLFFNNTYNSEFDARDFFKSAINRGCYGVSCLKWRYPICYVNPLAAGPI